MFDARASTRSRTAPLPPAPAFPILPLIGNHRLCCLGQPAQNAHAGQATQEAFQYFTAQTFCFAGHPRGTQGTGGPSSGEQFKLWAGISTTAEKSLYVQQNPHVWGAVCDLPASPVRGWDTRCTAFHLLCHPKPRMHSWLQLSKARAYNPSLPPRGAFQCTVLLFRATIHRPMKFPIDLPGRFPGLVPKKCGGGGGGLGRIRGNGWKRGKMGVGGGNGGGTQGKLGGRMGEQWRNNRGRCLCLLASEGRENGGGWRNVGGNVGCVEVYFGFCGKMGRAQCEKPNNAIFFSRDGVDQWASEGGKNGGGWGKVGGNGDPPSPNLIGKSGISGALHTVLSPFFHKNQKQSQHPPPPLLPHFP